jgi:ABC-type cobalt transport system substrate-binding protein
MMDWMMNANVSIAPFDRAVLVIFNSKASFDEAREEAEDAGIITEVSSLYDTHDFFRVGDVTFEPPVSEMEKLLRSAAAAAAEM